MASRERAFLKNPISKEDQTKLLKIFDILFSDPLTVDFLEPVDYVKLNILDYPKIISKPMDLGTVRKNLMNGKYSSLSELVLDIDLIWDNCKQYNRQGSEIYKMAQHCNRVFNRHFEKMFKQGRGGNSKPQLKKEESQALPPEKEEATIKNDFPNISEKIALVEKIRSLSPEGLSHVIKYIVKECPELLEDVNSEKLIIQIDSVDKKKYDSINDVINNFSNEKESKK